MNSHFAPSTNHYQSKVTTPDLQVDNLSTPHLYRFSEEDTETANQPELNLEDQRKEEKEIYKNSNFDGFVPEHNHGSVDYTSISNNHVHQCLDVTSPPRQMNNGTHIHYTEGYTLFEDGHHHYYKAWSGPAIPVGKGMHVHYYDFYTTTDKGHRHLIRGVDMPAPGTR